MNYVIGVGEAEVVNKCGGVLDLATWVGRMSPKKASNSKRKSIKKEETSPIKVSDESYSSPQRTTRSQSAKSNNVNNSDAKTPVPSSGQVRQRTPKSEYSQLMEGIGSPFPFAMSSPSLSFTPGGAMSYGEETGGSNTVNAPIPSSRDWSPFCNPTTFDFDGPNSSTGTPNFMYNNFRRGENGKSYTDQSPTENMSSSHWGNLLDSEQQDLSSPMGIMSFPSAPLSSSTPSRQDHLRHSWKDNMQHLYPHHHKSGTSSKHCSGVELPPNRRSNDLFRANITRQQRFKNGSDKKRKAGGTVDVENDESDFRNDSPPPSRSIGFDSTNAPPSPGIEAIAAAAREIESQEGGRSSKVMRRKRNKDAAMDKPPVSAPNSLKGIMGKLSYKEGEQYPSMSFATEPATSLSTKHANKGGLANPSQKMGSSSKGSLPLPQKSSTDEESAKKSITAQIQTYMQYSDAKKRFSGDVKGNMTNDMSNTDLLRSPQMLPMVGKKVPDISPATKQVNVTCNCKKSKCLKLYCDCFRLQQYCSGCNCNNCSNLKEFEVERKAAIASITERNPEAFKPRITKVESHHISPGSGSIARMGQHLQGCHCKKSACLKKYCECYQAEIPCHERCRCLECKNTPADREAKLLATGGSIKGGALPTAWQTAGQHQLNSSHLDLKTALLSPVTSTPSRDAPSVASSTGVDGLNDDLKPIYNKAQAEQAALEIVSAFLRGELTVPGLEYLSNKPIAMRQYSSPGSSTDNQASAEQSSLPLMERLSQFEAARQQQQENVTAE